eukprot:5948794-Pleurochrysis_carterae.AAC.2
MSAITSWCGTAAMTLPRTGASMAILISDASEWCEYCPPPVQCKSTVQIHPAGTPGLVACDDGSSAAGRFDQPGSSVTDVQGGDEHDGQVNDEDNVYIAEQIDAARQRKGHWEYRATWGGYPNPMWEPDDTLSTAGEQVQAMMREARNRAEKPPFRQDRNWLFMVSS